MKQVFINLPVNDINKSMEFYTKIGFTNNPQFSDDSSKCMVWSESIYVMLLTLEKAKSFAIKPIADTKKFITCGFSLSVESLDLVNEMVNNALSAGGTEPTEMVDHGFMQQRTLEDFDGHIWDIFYMDMSKFPQQ